MSCDQRLHLPPYGFVGANFIEVLVTLLWSSFQSASEHYLHLPPSLRRHACVSRFLLFISRCSHARAVAHSRLTVAGETPSTTEVSSIERPPKNRSSTSLLCCGSRSARRFRASSSATRSTSLACGNASSGSRLSRGAPAPRLAAPRFRA